MRHAAVALTAHTFVIFAVVTPYVLAQGETGTTINPNLYLANETMFNSTSDQFTVSEVSTTPKAIDQNSTGEFKVSEGVTSITEEPVSTHINQTSNELSVKFSLPADHSDEFLLNSTTPTVQSEEGLLNASTSIDHPAEVLPNAGDITISAFNSFDASLSNETDLISGNMTDLVRDFSNATVSSIKDLMTLLSTVSPVNASTFTLLLANTSSDEVGTEVESNTSLSEFGTFDIDLDDEVSVTSATMYTTLGSATGLTTDMYNESFSSEAATAQETRTDVSSDATTQNASEITMEFPKNFSEMSTEFPGSTITGIQNMITNFESSVSTSINDSNTGTTDDIAEIATSEFNETTTFSGTTKSAFGNVVIINNNLPKDINLPVSATNTTDKSSSTISTISKPTVPINAVVNSSSTSVPPTKTTRTTFSTTTVKPTSISTPATTTTTVRPTTTTTVRTITPTTLRPTTTSDRHRDVHTTTYIAYTSQQYIATNVTSHPSDITTISSTTSPVSTQTITSITAAKENKNPLITSVVISSVALNNSDANTTSFYNSTTPILPYEEWDFYEENTTDYNSWVYDFNTTFFNNTTIQSAGLRESESGLRFLTLAVVVLASKFLFL